MAHQFGHNAGTDGRWLALTERVYVEEARWLDRVIDACPTPEAVLESTPSCIEAAHLGLKQALSVAPATLPRGLTGLRLWLYPRHRISTVAEECSDRPLLFTRGDPRLLGRPMLSIVGTGNPRLMPEGGTCYRCGAGPFLCGEWPGVGIDSTPMMPRYGRMVRRLRWCR